MIKSKIDKLLQDYFYNYNPETLKLGIFSGNITLQDLNFNTQKINEDLKLADIPIRLKVGILSTLKIKISYLNLQLESLSIEDLILVIEPTPEHMSNIEEPHTETQKEQFLTHLLKNFSKFKKGEKLQKPKTEFLSNEHQEYLSRSSIGETQVEKSKEERKKMIDDAKKEKMNILGFDLYEIIFGRLEFKIEISNTKVYLEFDKVRNKQVAFQESFSALFQIKLKIDSIL